MQRKINFGGLFLLFLLFCVIVSCIHPDTATTKDFISTTEDAISLTEDLISSVEDTISITEDITPTEDTTWAEDTLI